MQFVSQSFDCLSFYMMQVMSIYYRGLIPNGLILMWVLFKVNIILEFVQGSFLVIQNKNDDDG